MLLHPSARNNVLLEMHPHTVINLFQSHLKSLPEFMFLLRVPDSAEKYHCEEELIDKDSDEAQLSRSWARNEHETLKNRIE